ncbi:BREX protein BrxB domain-containing protein [Haloglomus halophilum]|uniref:BREX protein BrxB domain-containing protein n=1 Tax=Haloglomus halophilum TaxID=2962672 RepID=UPI0020C975A3|nr:BREX protein BrxB domain-containing protein [Haloglomus halophilum]
MSAPSGNPLARFTQELVDFAGGERRGIRNPFVMVPVDPPIERRVITRLERWAAHGEPGRLADWEAVTDASGTPITVTSVRLDGLLPDTSVFGTCTDLGPLDSVDTEAVERTLQRNLASELVSELISTELGANGVVNEQTSVLVLLGLGGLYPFTRASELLDALDRRNVNTTVGIPFPGSVIGGRLSFFNEDARHYYPAHRIDEQIVAGVLTDV